MKRRGPSNHFTIPKWMQGLQAQLPEGTYTPDQVAKSLEISIAWHDGDLPMLISCVKRLVSMVPLKHQPFVKALLKGDVRANVDAFINKANDKVAEIVKEGEAIEPRREEIPAESCRDSGGDAVRLPADWENEDWLRDGRSKPRSRGDRAIRQAKRQQAGS